MRRPAVNRVSPGLGIGETLMPLNETVSVEQSGCGKDPYSADPNRLGGVILIPHGMGTDISEGLSTRRLPKSEMRTFRPGKRVYTLSGTPYTADTPGAWSNAPTWTRTNNLLINSESVFVQTCLFYSHFTLPSVSN